ncbi:MAG: hypothetical protein Q9217_007000 [Psora testacea]
MFKGLLDERESLDEGIWIDAWCINQKPGPEKQDALGCMDLIYKSARKIVVVLEDSTIAPNEEALLQCLLVNKTQEFLGLEENDKRIVTTALTRILSARWFKRAWCSHELQMGTNFVFLLPTTKDIYKITPASIEDLYSMTVDFRETQQDLEDRYTETFESYDVLTRSIFLTGYQAEKSLMCQFYDNMKLACTTESDKISISINAAGLQILHSGHNKSRDQCCWDLAMIALSSGDAMVLGGVEELLTFDDQQHIYYTETWFRCYTEFDDPMIDFGGSKLEEPSYITSIDLKHITLDLLCFPGLRPTKPKVLSIQRAEIFVHEVLKLSKSNQAPFIGLETYRKSVTEILACSMECGLGWMIQQMTFAEGVAGTMQRRLEQLEFDLWPALYDMLVGSRAHSLGSNVVLTEDDRLSLLRYVLFILIYGTEIITTSSQYHSGLFDNTDQYARQSASFELGNADRALVLYGFGAIRSSLELRLAVVPVALSSSSCAALSRLWILELVDGSDKVWKMVEKLPFFTFKSISDNGTDVVRLRDQTIVG